MNNLKLFIVVDSQMLDSVIPADVCEMLGYDTSATLREKTLMIEELVHDLYLISVNLKARGKECARSGLTTSEVRKAKDNYGDGNLLTWGQCKNLPRKLIQD